MDHPDPQGHGQSNPPTAEVEVQQRARMDGSVAQHPDARGGDVADGDLQRKPPQHTAGGRPAASAGEATAFFSHADL
jgi:hypothetical protein